MGTEDFVVEQVEASASRARLRVSVPAELRYFEGHFEGNPVLPGIAQLVALVHRRAREVFGALGTERRLVRVKFEATIRPGDVLEVALDLEPSATRPGETQLRFAISRGETRCASGGIVYGDDAVVETA
jgi:3-hydroxymyristoyl/3-hydroxydecanoyl-(acyl carrier protein) dehydratase